ncbi:LacI family DNA-binding transcriptional regulator [Frondihabitans cladoniiphilus]|uniref:LacI family DNA-binding transcriptional regulator n=1 Tax=Frondihabitans cladoniiphilus TaxID=715785 RepID=A0ABP8VKU5_9MICO
MKKTPTVYDVAADAGVSIATVSRVFRRPDDVRASTRETVLASVRALGYVPSASARGLAARRTGVLGLFFPDFDVVDEGDAPSDDLSGSASRVEVVRDIPDTGGAQRADLYFDEVLRGSELQAWHDGFTLMIGVGRGSNPVEVVTDIAGRVDGLALLAGSVPDSLLEHVSRRIPIVLIAGARRDDDFDHVMVANADGMHALTRHVVDDLGVRDPVFVAGPSATADDVERHEGFRRALAESGIDAEALPVLHGDFTRAGGRRVAADLLETLAGAAPPRAIMCSNDQTALGLMEVLIAAGVRIPLDTIVTGFDGIAESRMSSPRLTTVQQPMIALGRAAVATMRSRLEDPEQPPMARRLPVKLLLRESSEGSA